MLSLWICILSLLLVLLFKWDRKSQLPPGPKPLPLIGNIHQLPSSSFLSLLQQWHTTYGPIISIRIGAQVIVFLGSHHVAHEVMARQGAWCSSRPEIPFFKRILQIPLPSGLLPYGEKWKRHRRFQYSILNTQTTKSYRRDLELESTQVLWQMLESDDFETVSSRYAYNLASTLNFGQRSSEQDVAEIIEIQGLFIKNLIQGFVGELLSTILLFGSIPFIETYLNWVLGWENAGSKFTGRLRAFFTQHINNSIRNGHQQSWAQGMVHEAQKAQKAQESQESPETFENSRNWDEICLESFEVHMATSVTTQSSLSTFVLAALLYPDAVAVVQDELDAVIGPGRFPSFEDMPNLPRLNSFIKEVFRWRPLLPTSVPRVASKDMEYSDYRIPAGSVLVVSQSVINIDKAMFEEPELFQGDRYMKNPELPEPAAFGYGRRSCPGRHLARESTFIVISRLLWGYKIAPHPEDQNRNFDRVGSKVGFALFWPASFRATFQIRSPVHQTTVEREIRDKCGKYGEGVEHMPVS
ncbi:hypothetical protein PENARI_c096G07338 [Penicillium arizonense]|uniref:Cytochrome P450 n=1 Tax=Penicillium arizonense TaxID=1835702 RepID=A0A1F5L1J7_PENAI|nr:hypothetical protein PENARI_c096G07338 [Penicillium arizonense]OGE46870.1 hypothetical protein PENARI_c096G07338 [Penicillium arizonense]